METQISKEPKMGMACSYTAMETCTRANGKKIKSMALENTDFVMEICMYECNMIDVFSGMQSFPAWRRGSNSRLETCSPALCISGGLAADQDVTGNEKIGEQLVL